MAKDKDVVKGSLRDRIKAASTIKETASLDKTKIFSDQDSVVLPIPMLNVAFSGHLDGGFVSGITQWCGPSKHFKTGFLLLQMKTYMDKHPESIVLFYMNEFGSAGTKYFEAYDIDQSRVMLSPFLDIEQLRTDITTQIHGFARGDRVFIAIDSIGNAASNKEINDALEGNSAADFTRAKQLKSLFRIVTPHLALKDIPMAIVNHSYKTIEMFSKDVAAGGTGAYYSADNLFMLGRRQSTEMTGKTKELTGYEFVINVEKSRYVKEKSKIVLNISFENGISKWSGLLDNAVESGHVIKTKSGNTMVYSKLNDEKTYKETQTNNEQFWGPILKDVTFKEFIKSKYQLAETKLLGDNDEYVEDDLVEVDDTSM